MTLNFDSLYQRFVDESLQFEGDPHSEDDLLLHISSCVDHMSHKGLDWTNLPSDTLVMDLYTPTEFVYLVEWSTSVTDDSLEVY